MAVTVSHTEDPRSRAYRLRRLGRRVQPSKRVATCGQHSGGLVAVKAIGAGKGAYAGAYLCGSWHSCPTCSRLLAQHRARALQTHAGDWRGGGGTTYLLTLTLRHHRGQSLQHLLSVLRQSWDRFASGRQWKEARDALAIAGHVRGFEVRHGGKGWHPHLHVLLYCSADLARNEGARALVREWQARWVSIVASVDAECTPTLDRGLDLREGTEADYIAKLGWELAGGHQKRGRHGQSLGPWDLLEAAAVSGDAILWHEYASALHGARQLTWSRKIRAPLEARTTDAQAVENESQRGESRAMLTPRTYRAIEFAGLGLYFGDLVVAEPLTAAEWLRQAELDPMQDPRKWDGVIEGTRKPLPLRRWDAPQHRDVQDLGKRHGIALVKLWASSRNVEDSERWSEAAHAMAIHERTARGEWLRVEDRATLRELRQREAEAAATWAVHYRDRVSRGEATAADLRIAPSVRRRCRLPKVTQSCSGNGNGARKHDAADLKRCA